MKKQGRELATSIGDGITGVGGSSEALLEKRENHPQLFRLVFKRQTPIQVATRHVEETGRGA
jgi:hypothetical protein